MLQLKGVQKSFALGTIKVEVLRNICLDVSGGDLVSIMGSSGSGKSTLMNIIGLLSQPTAGTYRLRGREVSKMTDDEISAYRNENIGFVFQSFNLMRHLTAVDNVALPLIYRGLKRSEWEPRAVDMLNQVGLGARVAYKPDRLSGGQRQRVAIARALVGNPSVVLADEPTGALDEETANEVMQLLIQMNKEERVTMVIITHDIDVARQCRRLVRLEEGVLRQTSEESTLLAPNVDVVKHV